LIKGKCIGHGIREDECLIEVDHEPYRVREPLPLRAYRRKVVF
jgi:hypothetical protein